MTNCDWLQNEAVPGPLPLGVSVIDSSVQLFGLVFPRVAHKHRLQMLQHFNDCIKSSKSARQQAVQINIFTAVLCGLKVSTGSGSCSLTEDEESKVLVLPLVVIFVSKCIMYVSSTGFSGHENWIWKHRRAESCHSAGAGKSTGTLQNAVRHISTDCRLAIYWRIL